MTDRTKLLTHFEIEKKIICDIWLPLWWKLEYKEEVYKSVSPRTYNLHAKKAAIFGTFHIDSVIWHCQKGDSFTHAEFNSATHTSSFYWQTIAKNLSWKTLYYIQMRFAETTMTYSSWRHIDHLLFSMCHSERPLWWRGVYCSKNFLI